MYDQKQIDKIKNWLGAGSINLFGRPLAGKDFQGQRMAELFDGNLVGGGEILRGSNIPDNIKQSMNNGQLITSNDYVNIVLPYLSQSRLVGKPLILSSIGRLHGEEESVIRTTETSGHPLKAVIYLDISTDNSRNRWQVRKINNDRDNRHDDSKEVLETRFAEFEDKTLPVLDYYRKKGLLIEIDGNHIRDAVTQDILDALSKQIER